MAADIHPSAVVSPQAEIADDVSIGLGCIVKSNARIEAGCRLHSNVLIDSYTTLGPECEIHHGAVLGTPPQDLKWDPDQVSYLTVGAGTVIREYCTLNRGTGEGTSTTVGSRCMLMAYAHVAHNCVVGDEVVMANSINMAGHSEFHDWVIVGGGTNIQQFTRVGKGAFVGGSSGIRQDVPPFFRGSGLPVVPVGINTVGMQRRGYERDQISMMRKVYRRLYDETENLETRLEIILSEWGEMTEVQSLVDFIRSSKHGIIRPREQTFR